MQPPRKRNVTIALKKGQVAALFLHARRNKPLCVLFISKKTPEIARPLIVHVLNRGGDGGSGGAGGPVPQKYYSLLTFLQTLQCCNKAHASLLFDLLTNCPRSLPSWRFRAGYGCFRGDCCCYCCCYRGISLSCERAPIFEQLPSLQCARLPPYEYVHTHGRTDGLVQGQTCNWIDLSTCWQKYRLTTS